MTEIYAVDTSSFARTAESPMVSHLLSAFLIIGFPTAFWMGVLELSNYLFALELSITARLVIGVMLVGVLSVVWCFALLSARETESGEKLETALEHDDPVATSELC